VEHELLGIRDSGGARFVQRYADVQSEMIAGVSAYAADVRSRRYPGPEHSYSVEPAELESFKRDVCALSTGHG
jgi:3-methyl-2-oxobutanoate hydroxymethyltransferase